jgi:hypothetical protein
LGSVSSRIIEMIMRKMKYAICFYLLVRLVYIYTVICL